MLAPWNGARFDLPFPADRARRHGLALGLRLRLSRRIGDRRSANMYEGLRSVFQLK